MASLCSCSFFANALSLARLAQSMRPLSAFMMHGGVQAWRMDAPCCLSASVGPPLGGALGGPLGGPLRGGDRGGLPSAYIVLDLNMARFDGVQDTGGLLTMGMMGG